MLSAIVEVCFLLRHDMGKVSSVSFGMFEAWELAALIQWQTRVDTSTSSASIMETGPNLAFKTRLKTILFLVKAFSYGTKDLANLKLLNCFYFIDFILIVSYLVFYHLPSVSCGVFYQAPFVVYSSVFCSVWGPCCLLVVFHFINWLIDTWIEEQWRHQVKNVSMTL